MKRMHSSSIARFSLAIGVAAALAASTNVARANAWDKMTTVSFSQPVEVPGYVLQPGKYVMKLVDFPSDRHVVQFMNVDRNHVYAAAMAITAYRPEATDRTVITFYEARAGQPEPIKDWYYPGDRFGAEFVYPKEHLTEIAAITHETTPAAFDTRSQTESSTVAAAEPVKEAEPAPVVNETPTPIAEETAPAESAAAPIEIAQAAPPPQETPAVAPQSDAPAAPSELPKTSSNLPEIALLGVFSIGGAVTARRLRRS